VAEASFFGAKPQTVGAATSSAFNAGGVVNFLMHTEQGRFVSGVHCVVSNSSVGHDSIFVLLFAWLEGNRLMRADRVRRRNEGSRFIWAWAMRVRLAQANRKFIVAGRRMSTEFTMCWM
tara:strand:+ start:8833 stop:9189 length:357 start_codon:yes stop_codon:yes gene_type:complete